jgi:hypothetical protein
MFYEKNQVLGLAKLLAVYFIYVCSPLLSMLWSKQLKLMVPYHNTGHVILSWAFAVRAPGHNFDFSQENFMAKTIQFFFCNGQIQLTTQMDQKRKKKLFFGSN